MNRRKFLSYVGCSCCGYLLPSCTTAPITERKQLSIIPEAKINSQAAQAYERFKSKAKLIGFACLIDRSNKENIKFSYKTEPADKVRIH